MEGGVISRVARNIRRRSNFHARNARTIELLCLDRARYRTHGICSSSYAVSLRVDPSGIHRDIRKFIHAERSRYKESCISRWNPLIVASIILPKWEGGISDPSVFRIHALLHLDACFSNHRSSKILSSNNFRFKIGKLHFFVRYFAAFLLSFLFFFF